MKKGLSLFLTSFMLVFYFGVVVFILFSVVHIDTLTNFIYGMIFESLGFLLLVYFILGGFIRHIKTGFFVPLILVTIAYVIILNVINITLIALLNDVLFVLLNIVLLFIYCLISIPMFIMGKK